MTKPKNINQLSAVLNLTARDIGVLCIVARYQDTCRKKGLHPLISDITSNARLVAQTILGASNESPNITAVAEYYREWNEQCELYHKN